jgi:ABC-2 type transport system ATP-binding protein
MLIEVAQLTKVFGTYKAVDGVSFAIGEGEIVGLLGPNGAGKTTIIHMILGLILPSSGIIRVFGRPFAKNREYILTKMNFTSPYVWFPRRLTVLENLTVFARLYGIRDRTARITKLLRTFAIEDLRDKPISRLSSGEVTRVGLCKAFMNDPKVLLLDEPTAYLDPEVALLVTNTLRKMRDDSGTAILYTSHNMVEVERMCDRVVFLNQGRVIANGTPIEVTQAILEEDRDEPALEDVFLRVGRGRPHEAA